MCFGRSGGGYGEEGGGGLILECLGFQGDASELSRIYQFRTPDMENTKHGLVSYGAFPIPRSYVGTIHS